MEEHYNLISSYKWFYLFKLRESVKVDCASLEYCYKDLLLDKTLSRICISSYYSQAWPFLSPTSTSRLSAPAITPPPTVDLASSTVRARPSTSTNIWSVEITTVCSINLTLKSQLNYLPLCSSCL